MFTYPSEWRERISGPGLAGFTYVVEVGSRKRRYAVVDVRIEPAGIRVNGKNVPITKENIDENKRLIVALTKLSLGGGSLSNPTRMSAAGLPGFRFELSHVTAPGGGVANSHFIRLFRGPTMYTVSCVYTSESADEVTNACDEVLDSLRIRG